MTSVRVQTGPDTSEEHEVIKGSVAFCSNFFVNFSGTLCAPDSTEPNVTIFYEK